MHAFTTPLRGFLASTDVTPPIVVVFQYNPRQVDDKRSVNYATLNAPGLLMPTRQYTHGGDRTISFTVYLDGRELGPFPILTDPDGGLTPELNRYRAFLYPKNERWMNTMLLMRGTFVPLYQDQLGEEAFAAPPTCLFGLGERIVECVVTDVGVKELEFNMRLAPVRAEVSVTLAELGPQEASLLSGIPAF